jgi:hypothetical protein
MLMIEAFLGLIVQQRFCSGCKEKRECPMVIIVKKNARKMKSRSTNLAVPQSKKNIHELLILLLDLIC